MGLHVSLQALVAGEYSVPVDFGNAVEDVQFTAFAQLSQGTAANQADLLYRDRRTLAASASETLDLQALVNVFGQAMNFARVKGILLASVKTNSTELQFGPNSSNGFTAAFGDASDRVRVRAGGFAMLAAYDAVSYAVTPTTRLLYVVNAAGASAQYDIMIVGASA